MVRQTPTIKKVSKPYKMKCIVLKIVRSSEGEGSGRSLPVYNAMTILG